MVILCVHVCHTITFGYKLPLLSKLKWPSKIAKLLFLKSLQRKVVFIVPIPYNFHHGFYEGNRHFSDNSMPMHSMMKMMEQKDNFKWFK
ncbi:hypothetical protein JTE90_019584 [Oedothorax gibbosus]|uniref:Uncharacterized protein n=1 Tax=Oedothorax gibbosus TaxID=931172 RepID=A0AAV6V470_9ARAC|nr:hypothetical protein JTE90_019584 [Oedothorax gibbosus]